MTRERPYWHEVIGHNFRMPSLSAAIGIGQLERWDQLVGAREEIACHYATTLPDALERRPVAPWATEACWLYTATHEDRGPLLAALREGGFDARAIWPALTDLPLYADGRRGEYPVAEQVAAEAFWLPTWSGMPMA